MSKLLLISRRDARVFIHALLNRPDESRDIQAALRLRAVERKFKEYLGEYYVEMQALTDEFEEVQLSLVPNSVEFHQRASDINRKMRDLDNSLGAEPAANNLHEGILLDHDEFTKLSTTFKGMKNIPAGGKAGEIWEGIYNAFEAVKDVKVAPVKHSETTSEEKAV